jgi:hypothetical protein
VEILRAAARYALSTLVNWIASRLGLESGEAVWRRITDAVRQLANQTPAGPLH